jgi:serine/threonine-protein kinase RsbW
MAESAPLLSSLELPAVLESLPQFIEFLSRSAQLIGFGAQEINKIELAGEEAIVNIVNYAYGDKSGNITVTCRSENHEKLFVEIIDSGLSFNPLDAKKPDLDADMDDRLIGGLGIYLTEKLVDTIEYKREDNKNILTLAVFKSTER